MILIKRTSETETNSVEFNFTNSFSEEDTLQANFVKHSYSAEEEAFLNAMRLTANEFDDVLRKLAD